MLFEGDYYSPSEVFSCINDETSSMMMSMKKKKMINKRRFSDEQVKSLESIFENETKLEPKKKVQLARELGLEPRQVAIWFQNKRARYKSRQLERDYTILQSNYDSLASQFDALKKEKQALLSQLQKLKELVEKDDNNKNKKNNKEEEESSNKSSKSKSDKRQYDQQEWEEVQNKPAISLSVEGSEYGTSSIMSSDEGSSVGNVNPNYLVSETSEMVMGILAAIVPGPVVTDHCGSMIVPAESGWDDGLRPDVGLFDGDSYGQWWDFWS